MPGLVGVSDRSLKEDKGETLDRMIQVMKHEQSYQVDRYVGEGFSGGRIHTGIFHPKPQPLLDSDSGLVGFMEGKLFPSEDDPSRLNRRSEESPPRDDLELCMRLYGEVGERFVESLNGSFIIAIFDFRRKKLLLATDRFGLRPLYYSVNSDRIVFGSEIKAILQDKSVPRDLDRASIIDFFHYGEILGNGTFFESVKILPPAAVATYHEGDFFLSSYWKLQYRPDRSRSEDDIVRDLVRSFSHAVRIRMKENLRYGISLSGGLDSRAVLAAMKKEGLLRDTLAFTHSIPRSNELRIAKEVARVAGVQHEEVLLDADSLVCFAEDAVYRTDGMANILHCYILDCFDRIREKVDVSFHGFAGDLLLGGSCLDDSILMERNERDLLKAIQKKITLFSPEMLQNLLKSDFIESHQMDFDESLQRALAEIDEPEVGNRSDSFFLQNHVRRFTRLGGILYRSKCEEAMPTYDNDFFDVVLSIPPEMRKGHRIFLEFLRALSPELAREKYVKFMVPADASFFAWRVGARILSFNKRVRDFLLRISGGKLAFGASQHFVDFDRWFRFEPRWRDLLNSTLLDSSARTREYFRRDYVEELVRDHETGRSDNAVRLALLITFEIFLREFLDNPLPTFPTLS